MLLKRFYDDTLAQASYLIGCQATGDAVVIDANRDIEQYLQAAAAEQVLITHVTETHIHADYVSGSRELARAAGATLLLSAEGGPDWQYAFAKADGATLLRDGDRFMVGNIRLDVMHTPGHTPEHIVFVVTDTAGADRPMGVVSGDFLFVGDVGRPDLLERAAKIEGTMEAGARQLFASLRRIATLPDYLQIWPGHGAGSACGKALGAVPTSTLGYERLFNWAFQVQDEDAFVRAVLAGQPEPPRYFARMKQVNRDGPTARQASPPAAMSLDRIAASGALVVDTRATAAFAAGHLPGSVVVPLGRNFTTYAGSILPDDRDLVLLAADAGAAERARSLLSLIGLDRVAGWVAADALAAWEAAGHPIETTPQVDSTSLAGDDDAYVVDVRGASEWDEAHIAGAHRQVLATLADNLDAIPRDRKIVLHCGGGGRSNVAAGLLLANGFTDVSNLAGGIDAWRAAGLPVEAGDDV